MVTRLKGMLEKLGSPIALLLSSRVSKMAFLFAAIVTLIVLRLNWMQKLL